MGKVGAAFINNLSQAFLYVVVTPFVATYEEFGPQPSSKMSLQQELASFGKASAILHPSPE